MSLKQQAITGVKWAGLSRGLATLFEFITTAILARLLAPEDFGLMGMVLVITGFAQAFADAGISNALIYHQDATDEQLSSLYWVNIIAGLIIFLIVWSTQNFVVAYFQEPRISIFLTIVASRFLINSVGQQFRVLIQKEMQFRTLSIIEITASSISSIIALGMAFNGGGIWSLVFRIIIQAMVASIMLIFWAARNKRLPKIHFRRADLKGFLGFGLFQMGERAINYISSNVDNLVIGRFLGAEALGYYSLAYQLIKFPLARFNPIITQVAFPAFSKIQDDNVLRKGYLKVVSFVSTVTFPMLAGLFIVAPLLVEVVYGSTWLPTVAVIRILCIVGMLKAQDNPIGSLLLSKGRADIGFYWNIFALIIMSIASLIGVQWGIEGVAMATLIIAIFVYFPASFYIRWTVVKLKVLPYLKNLIVPIIASAVMMVVLWSLSPIWNNFSQLFGLIGQICFGSIIYLSSIYMLNRSLWMEIKQGLFNG